MIKSGKRKALLIVAVISLAILLALELTHNKIFAEGQYSKEIYNIFTRYLGGIACLIFVYLYSVKWILRPAVSVRGLLVFLPCMAVAVNNFPIITFFSGEAYIEKDLAPILLYAILCLGVGFFEEMAFRGCVFPIILQRRGNTWKDVFVSTVFSSLIFGVVHIVNLFVGADIVSVILQIGYSFLIGGMCSVILIKTHNIWYCVILHAVYNFCGGVVPNCGGGTIWNAPEIALTAVVAVIVAIYVVYLLIKIQPREIQVFLSNESGTHVFEEEKQ